MKQILGQSTGYTTSAIATDSTAERGNQSDQVLQTPAGYNGMETWNDNLHTLLIIENSDTLQLSFEWKKNNI